MRKKHKVSNNFQTKDRSSFKLMARAVILKFPSVDVI
ncbi:hypothetical protein TcasGA2_TC034238 [Tribolium castaneum]|uniref:Uncharacterized protein n=1 Tax=Tribolium castaneum TaxID=7070 RepID=A0A139WBY1_TRICA|nr:hypothetical protein TcasGA2_TC034238 [Tribolium castaneum]